MSAARRTQGFTLLEVLVALAILASALYASTGSIRSAARQQTHREASMLAHWAALNVATELSLTARGEDPPAAQEVTLYNQPFIASIAPQRDEEGKITALTISVAAQSVPDAQLNSLTVTLP